MSFRNFKTFVEYGDTVILYLTINQVYSVEATPKTLSKKGEKVDNIFQTPFGALKCSDLIGKEYGTKVDLSKGWGYILQPSPDLWTSTLPHRTQIIYTPDISMIILQLEISPGSTVIESGTGSASLSHALIRAVKPGGHLYTFDFHQERVELAEKEFKTHAIGDFATVKQRDVCAEGFGDELNGKIDAVFLDLPHPWLALDHISVTFKESGGRICSFSPCIEQVQKTCLALTQFGFQEIKTTEVLQTNYSVYSRTMNKLNLEILKTKKDAEDENKCEKQTAECLASIPTNPQPAHTGFLTFATFPPLWARSN